MGVAAAWQDYLYRERNMVKGANEMTENKTEVIKRGGSALIERTFGNIDFQTLPEAWRPRWPIWPSWRAR
jgi:hypothetical protein